MVPDEQLAVDADAIVVGRVLAVQAQYLVRLRATDATGTNEIVQVVEVTRKKQRASGR